MRQWEAKVEEFVRAGDDERADWARDNLKKAHKKVRSGRGR